MNLARTETCIECNKPYETTLPGNTCPQCLIKLHKPIGDIMSNHTVGEKICVICQKPYKPTSNVQRFCPDCKQNKSHGKSAGASAPKKKSATDQAPKKISFGPLPQLRIDGIEISVKSGILENLKIVLNRE